MMTGTTGDVISTASGCGFEPPPQPRRHSRGNGAIPTPMNQPLAGS